MKTISVHCPRCGERAEVEIELAADYRVETGQLRQGCDCNLTSRDRRAMLGSTRWFGGRAGRARLRPEPLPAGDPFAYLAVGPLALAGA